MSSEQQEPTGFLNDRLNWIPITALGILVAGVFLITLYPQGGWQAAVSPSKTLPSTSTTEPTNTSSPSPPPTLTPTQEPPPTASPGPTSTPLTLSLKPRYGTLILSIQVKDTYQLFAYQPFLSPDQDAISALPLTQLTQGEDDKIHPALHPKGSKLAYASNRQGSWDILIWDLSTNTTQKYTSSTGYEGYPAWSPDGQWLTYESYQEKNFEVIIRDAAAGGEINLSTHPRPDFSPHWSPQGRKISYISTRSGNKQIQIADLDAPEKEQTVPHPAEMLTDIQHPTWSPNGSMLAFSGINDLGQTRIYLWDSEHPERVPEVLGAGCWPVWGAGGKLLYTVIERPNRTYLTAYPIPGNHPQVMLPAVELPGPIQGISWAPEVLSPPFSSVLDGTPTPSGHPGPDPTAAASSRVQLKVLPDVQAPNPKLNPHAVEAFYDLKNQVKSEAGWDFLASLSNAYLPLTTPPEAGDRMNWLYTGRGIQISDLPLQAGWMAVVKENYDGQTYWRVYLRARLQDGSLGKPLKEYPWNFDPRYSGSMQAYEEGGQRSDTLTEGYWVDFTELAEARGWSRFPAFPNWKTIYPATRWQQYAFQEDLTWHQAMLEIYPPAALVTPTPITDLSSSP